MKEIFELTQEKAKYLFSYHEDGYLIWNVSSNRRIIIGSRAGYLCRVRNGVVYYYVRFNKIAFKVSRIIFLWHHGYLPEIVDHENRNTLDDRVENLRAAIPTQNSANRNKNRDCANPYMGIVHQQKKWIASCGSRGKVYRSKYFDTPEEAALAYNKLAVKHHKEFALLNIIQP